MGEQNLQRNEREDRHRDARIEQNCNSSEHNCNRRERERERALPSESVVTIMEPARDLNAPLLPESDGDNSIEEVRSPSGALGSKRASSDLLTDDRLLLPQLSGKWIFKVQQSNLGKWDEKFQDAGDGSQERQEYNRKQRATLQAYQEVHNLDKEVHDLDLPLQERASTAKLELAENLAVNASNLANILLLILKVYASVRSGSIAIIASTLDSLLDLLAGAILWFTRYTMRSYDKYKFPIGNSRVQPVGIVIFAAAMATLGIQVLIEAVRQLVDHEASDKMSTSELVWLCSIMGLATIVKLGLFLYCRSFENEIIRAYSKDHYFDVLTNVVGLGSALLANWFYWWIDPVGAIILAVYTIVNWSQTVLENAVSLIGKGAPPETIQKFTYLALTHSSKIKRIDTVRAYTFGLSYFVEVDIELPEDMPLKEAHDIGQSLQDKFERLPEVERAFVHLDHECFHKPEHSLQI